MPNNSLFLESPTTKTFKGVSENINLNNGSRFISFVKNAIKNKQIFIKSALKFGTPQYLLDEEALLNQATLFKNAFKKNLKNLDVFYAIKSNDLPFLVNKLKKIGIHADVSSLFELKLALKLGFNKIIFTAPYKETEAIELAIKNSDRVVLNIDQLDELILIEKIAKKNNTITPISFRINLNENTNETWTKFGISLPELKKITKIIQNNKYLKWVGIHFHSSWNTNPDKYLKAIELVGNFLKSNFTISELSDLIFLDLGGGFYPEGSGSIEKKLDDKSQKTNYTICVEKITKIESFSLKITQALKKYIFQQKKLNIWLEPGRFISSQSTTIVLKVISTKNGALFVDGGINLIGGANFEFEYFPIINISNPSLEQQKTKIYGPLCDPDDFWGFSYFGKPAKIGDILIVLHQGAYTFSTAWRWQRPTAAYVSFYKNRLKLVKKTETFDERYAGCDLISKI
ncbi:MAG: hypothetical protein WCX88_01715 [Patescibacteria group bacterium]